MPTVSIYRITAPSGKSYIGQTRQSIKTRFRQHQNRLSKCRLLKSAIDKYGWDQMKTEVILTCGVNEADDYERRFIAAYGSGVL